MFIDAKLKIKRANQHIDELNRIFADFLKSDFCGFRIEKEPDTGQNVVKFKQTKSMPCEVPLIIGDAIHNLRSALDLMACEIVALAGGTPDTWTHFPFRDTRKELIDTINGGQIKVAGIDIVDLIVDTIKPYKGGNDALHAIHSLDITDKHRLLIPTASISAFTNVNARVGGMTFASCSFVVGKDGIINIGAFPAGSDIQIEGHATPAFDIRFDEGQALSGESVIPTLHQLSQLVFSVIETIEKAYLARAKPTA
jgi:hypothetical protein